MQEVKTDDYFKKIVNVAVKENWKKRKRCRRVSSIFF